MTNKPECRDSGIEGSSKISSSIIACDVECPARAIPERFVEDETKEQGSTKLGTYWTYFQSSGGLWYWLPILAVFVGHQVFLLGRSWFIAIWTNTSSKESMWLQTLLKLRHTNVNKTHDGLDQHRDLASYLAVYWTLSIVLCITASVRYYLVYRRSIQASKQLFESLIFAVLRAPLRWLDTVPIGRVLNRFTSDFESIDSWLGLHVGALTYAVIQIFGIAFAVALVSPWMLVIGAVLFFINIRITFRYIAGARELKRLESIAKSPMFELFGATLTGLASIRTFGRMKVYIDRMLERIDIHSCAVWYLWLFNGWVTF